MHRLTTVRPQAAALPEAFKRNVLARGNGCRKEHGRDGTIRRFDRIGGIGHARAAGRGRAETLRQLEVLGIHRDVAGLDRRVVGDRRGKRPRAFAQSGEQSDPVDRFAFLDNMSAAMPETIGAEKLVPRLLLIWSV